MRLLICAGMTGGGVYPALAVLQALENKTEAVMWVGSQSGLEEALLSPFKVAYKSIPGGGIHGISLRKLPGNIKELIRGFSEARSIVNSFKPDVVLYTGGYLGVPMAFAAKNIPSVVFIPDIEPGLALKVILRNADATAISTERSFSYLRNKENVNLTGYPLRSEIKQWQFAQARAHFNIDPSARVVLVFGGSKGAQSINKALIPILDQLTEELHVIHITGEANWDDTQADNRVTNLARPERYHPFPFMHTDMGAAFAAADLAVCRAGASTIGELPYFGLPAILIPYPHAWQYQYQNAQFLTQHGGALILKDEDLENTLLSSVIETMNDEKKMQSMKQAMLALAISNAAEEIAQIVEKEAEKNLRKTQ